MDKVVKCTNEQCGQHFMHTETDTACPFCHTPYVEVVVESPKERKVPVKHQKESFKMWKESSSEQ